MLADEFGLIGKNDNLSETFINEYQIDNFCPSADDFGK